MKIIVFVRFVSSIGGVFTLYSVCKNKESFWEEILNKNATKGVIYMLSYVDDRLNIQIISIDKIMLHGVFVSNMAKHTEILLLDPKMFYGLDANSVFDLKCFAT